MKTKIPVLTPDYRIKMNGQSFTQVFDTLDEAVAKAKKMSFASMGFTCYVDEYVNEKPTGVWYRVNNEEVVKNTK